MAGGGSSELRAVLVEIRRLDARLTECEKDLRRLAGQVAEMGALVEPAGSAEAPLRVTAAAVRAAVQSAGVVAKGKAKRKAA